MRRETGENGDEFRGVGRLNEGVAGTVPDPVIRLKKRPTGSDLWGSWGRIGMERKVLRQREARAWRRTGATPGFGGLAAAPARIKTS